MMTFEEQIHSFHPFNIEEEKDKALILSALSRFPDVYKRENPFCHMTASSWILNQTMDKVLFCYHRIYQSWSWLGGHADNEKDLLQVARREAYEESGLTSLSLYTDEIFSLEALTVSGHYRKGEYVPSHIHLNATYLFLADEREPLRIKEDENSGLAWFRFEEALSKSSEPWMIDHVYKKLIEKSRKITDSKKNIAGM